jgi:signal peptidase I
MNDDDKPRPRLAVIAALLSLVLPGAGQVYIGEARRGIAYMAALAAVLAASLLLMGKALGVWVVALGMGVVFLGAFIDAIGGALRRQTYRLKPYNRWYVYAGLLAAGPLANQLLGLAGLDVPHYRPFSTPTTSMCPTLVIGDNFIADTNYYADHEPAFGDVAVYRLAQPGGDDLVYVKRIVGLPGDRIALRRHRLLRNGAMVDEPYVEITRTSDALADTSEVTVPDGMLFMLGDNRANSLDSRSADRHGLVPAGNLLGRAGEIYWPDDWARFGLQLQPPYDTGAALWQKARTKCDPLSAP